MNFLNNSQCPCNDLDVVPLQPAIKTFKHYFNKINLYIVNDKYEMPECTC